jgi:hypothetical protein
MILPFSTHLNGKPTMFTNKIVKGLWQHHSSQMNEFARSMKLPEYYVFEDLSVYDSNKLGDKLHTIREDKNDRWKPGTKIDFFINCRQKNMFRFAPVLPVVSIQEIEIVYDKVFGKILRPEILIDNVKLHPMRLEELALNDGFDNVQDFFAYFDKDFKGKIIHWTNLKY